MQPRDLSGHVPYEAGRGNEEVARELGVDPGDLVVLSSNENPYGPAPAAAEAIREGADGVGRYPKASHADLHAALSDRWDCASEQVWLAPGGDGSLDYLHRALLEPGDRILVPEPGFAYYAMSARYHHGEVATYPLRRADDFAQSADRVLDAYDGERIVFLISPHSPTGSEVPLEEVAALAAGTDDDTLVVVDEAYGEFSASPSAAELLDERDDVAVLRTFSKAYGLAGLRVGYLLTPRSWAGAYARVNTPFAVNELGCRAALAALDDEAHVERSVEGARWAREYMRAELDARVWPSAGNFVLAAVGDGTAVAGAAEREGVLVRDTSSFGLPGCIRITCGTETETRTAVETLNDVLADRDAPDPVEEAEPRPDA
ncbi:MAG: histidinol-phosphate transaminase [Haloarculaceae archaeon]